MNQHSVRKLVPVLVLVTVLAFSGCSKLFKGSDSNPYFKVSQQFKNYCYFNKGSQWTYKDNSTGKTYNVTINNIFTYIGFQPQNPSTSAFSFDVIQMRMDSNPLNLAKENIYATKFSSDTSSMNDMLRVFYANGTDTTFVLAFAPQFPLRERQLLGGQEGTYTNMEILPYYYVGQKKYDNVYHSRDKFASTVNGVETKDSVTMDFYLAEHYGIIKWTHAYKGDTTTYTLTSSSLTQTPQP